MVSGEMIAAQVAVIRDAGEYVESMARTLGAEGLKVKTSVWYGSPATSIVDAAEAARADIIVMNSHGRTGLGRLVLGSVAEHVLRGTRTPILLLRAPGAPVDRPAGQARPAKEAARV